MNGYWKTIGVLLPGAILGGGAGVLLAGFQIDPASPLVSAFQTVGIAMMVGAIVLRIVLAQRGFAISGPAALAFNTACVFLSAFVTFGLIESLKLQGEGAVYAVIALAWAPCLAIAALAQVLFTAWRSQPATPAKRD